MRRNIEAGEVGLTGPELKGKTGHEDARKFLKRLANSDEDWAKVIDFAGKPGHRYRIPSP